VSGKFKLVATSCALALGLGGATAAWAAPPELDVIYKPAERFETAIEAHKVEQRFGAIAAKGKRYALEAKRLSRQEYGLAGGVSQATLDAIASCESGGDPTVVDASGTYYGLYQFDLGTWASVGSTGSPAEASPEEQTYRASLLYARAGSSPWPVCGQ
jgi:soluble lytic murein transglycosylase-like protein